MLKIYSISFIMSASKENDSFSIGNLNTNLLFLKVNLTFFKTSEQMLSKSLLIKSSFLVFRKNEISILPSFTSTKKSLCTACLYLKADFLPSLLS